MHKCCHKYGLNVKVTCIDRFGNTEDHIIVLSEEQKESM